MQSLDTEDSDLLSPEGLLELLSDEDDISDLASEGPIFFAEKASVLQKTELGQRILEVGLALLNKPLREDAGPNEDRDGVIRSLFLEGIPWPASLWDNWKKNHPSSRTARPPWCAAFASYCVRKGYEAVRVASKLPPLLSGSTGDLRTRFRKQGRFIERDELFTNEGKLKSGAPMPAPGDIVLWQTHTGLLYDMYTDGTYHTLEGNTRSSGTPQEGVYLKSNRPDRKVPDPDSGKLVWSLTGFCRLASMDG